MLLEHELNYTTGNLLPLSGFLGILVVTALVGFFSRVAVGFLLAVFTSVSPDAFLLETVDLTLTFLTGLVFLLGIVLRGDCLGEDSL